jgi:hypothetical protein
VSRPTSGRKGSVQLRQPAPTRCECSELHEREDASVELGEPGVVFGFRRRLFLFGRQRRVSLPPSLAIPPPVM